MKVKIKLFQESHNIINHMNSNLLKNPSTKKLFKDLKSEKTQKKNQIDLIKNTIKILMMKIESH